MNVPNKFNNFYDPLNPPSGFLVFIPDSFDEILLPPPIGSACTCSTFMKKNFCDHIFFLLAKMERVTPPPILVKVGCARYSFGKTRPREPRIGGRNCMIRLDGKRQEAEPEVDMYDLENEIICDPEHESESDNDRRLLEIKTALRKATPLHTVIATVHREKIHVGQLVYPYVTGSFVEIRFFIPVGNHRFRIPATHKEREQWNEITEVVDIVLVGVKHEFESGGTIVHVKEDQFL